ncbi:hypothetical protein KFK09_021136 [Dendrobium nobile]|uniref:Uncharacterized protein n=1 Tax=Dendrobium nobile TaxID=94219 RepID=A0A8T3APC2_DENNO|nr:hypothetical protein KFK09_021136 [Dendrobium nobile]
MINYHYGLKVCTTGNRSEFFSTVFILRRVIYCLKIFHRKIYITDEFHSFFGRNGRRKMLFSCCAVCKLFFFPSKIIHFYVEQYLEKDFVYKLYRNMPHSMESL